ncbi:hypothetical protein [Methylomagnum sp.]
MAHNQPINSIVNVPGEECSLEVSSAAGQGGGCRVGGRRCSMDEAMRNMAGDSGGPGGSACWLIS